MAFVIRRAGGGYVNWPGRAKSYVPRAVDARNYDTEEQAAADCCGNETPVNLGE